MILFAPGDYVLRAAGALRPPTVRLLIRGSTARAQQPRGPRSQPTAGPSFWLSELSAQNLKLSQNNGVGTNMLINTVVLSKFDNICELQPTLTG
jgi:hypothetical protein